MIPYAHDEADVDADEELERALFVRRTGALAGERRNAPPRFAQVMAAVDEAACASPRVRTLARATAGVIAMAACAAALFTGIRPQGGGSVPPSIVAEPEVLALPIELVGGYSGQEPRENTCAPPVRTASCASFEPTVAVCQGP